MTIKEKLETIMRYGVKLNKKQSKFIKFIVRVLYKIDDGLLIMYYKTKFKPFEIMGAYVGGLGNKMNKEME